MLSDKAKSTRLSLIKSILRENSGGMKMTALLPELIDRLRNEPEIGLGSSFSLGEFDTYLKTLEPEGIHVLTYDYDMGGVIREKQFVYTKVKSK